MPKTEPPVMDDRINALKRNRERILIRLVTTIARACTMYATRSERPFGLSISQMIVLGELFSHNGCRQEDLRASVYLDKGNVTRALQWLEEQGLVKRVQDPVDRRVTRVYVTKRACAIEQAMFARAVVWDDRLTSGFTPQEHETLIDLLLRMEVNAKDLARNDTPEA